MSNWTRRHPPLPGEVFGDVSAVREAGVEGKFRLAWIFACGVGHELQLRVSNVRQSLRRYGHFRCPQCRREGRYEV